MKKTLLVLAIMQGFALGASAQVAQSSPIETYAMVDLNLMRIKNGSLAPVSKMDGGTWNASRFGFRGTKDIGDGLSAGFVLEAGLNADDGTGKTQLFNRRSTASLMGSFGEVRLGHDNAPNYFNLIYFEPYGGGGVASLINLVQGGGTPTPLLSGAQTASRTDNAVSYFLPNTFGGVYGQVQVALKEDKPGYKHTGLRFGYANSKLDTAISTGSTDLDKGQKFEIVDLGGKYNFGSFTLMGQYITSKTGLVSGLIANGGNTTTSVGIAIPYGKGEFRSSFAKAKGKDYFQGSDSTMKTVGYFHSFTKQVGLYASASNITNTGIASYAVYPGTANSAVTATTVNATGVKVNSNLAGKDSNGYEFGLRLIF